MHRSLLTMISVVAIASFLGCSKKVAVNQPSPPTPAPPAEQRAPQSAPVQAAAAPAQTPAPAPAKPRFPDAATRARIDELLARIEDAYFDYDKDSLRPDALKTMEANARELRTILADYPDYKLTIEGHADERGSSEYNVALGDRRAAAAKEYLVHIGIPAAQLKTVSYGKERPACTESNESCWQKNRRIHIIPAATQE